MQATAERYLGIMCGQYRPCCQYRSDRRFPGGLTSRGHARGKVLAASRPHSSTPSTGTRSAMDSCRRERYERLTCRRSKSRWSQSRSGRGRPLVRKSHRQRRA